MKPKLPRLVVPISIVFFVLLVISIVAPASADVFGGGGNSGNSIFGNISDGINGIFDGINGAFPGGAVIPGLEPTPTVGPGTPTPIPPSDRIPNSAGEVRNVKITLEWDALSIGGEVVYPQEKDPLVCMHLGDTLAVSMGYSECAGKGYPGLLTCDPCSVATVDNFALDSQNRLVPQNVLGVKVKAEEPPGKPHPPSPGGPPAPPAPYVWQVCVEHPCQETRIKHAIVGWCGQDPIVKKTSGYNTKIPIHSNGPNSYTLPNAVSNKYIRRDGYAFTCVRKGAGECTGVECSKDNYMEFQTMIYPSNAISLYAKVENVSELPIDNVIVKANTLTYSAEGESPLSHNLDYLVDITDQTSGSNASFPDSDYYNNNYKATSGKAEEGWGYVHGNDISSLGNMPPLIFKIGKDERSAPGAPIMQFQTDPFDLAPGEIKELPFQRASSEFTAIPGTSWSMPSGEIKPVEQAKPCECQSVKIHDALGTPSDGCNRAVSSPTIDQCRLYYGIGVIHGGKDYRSHSGGYVCDLQGITVDGCPPPWCFDGAMSTSGPMDKCPDLNGDGTPDKIPNKQDPDGDGVLDDEWWYETYDNARSGYATSTSSRSGVLAELIPDQVLGFFGGHAGSSEKVDDVYAFGCPQPCQNQPPPGTQGVGAIIPRDYNFICDPNDKYPTGKMVELKRCNDANFNSNKYSTIIPSSERNLFRTYRDVTAINGCGYNASSNNSVVGPIQIVAEYGGHDNERTGRSVLLASIPIGGRFTDDQARPYGWPSTGEIEQDWGYTGQAASSGPYSSDPTKTYGEYRYCDPNDVGVAPTPEPKALDCNVPDSDIDPALNNVRPKDELIDYIKNSVIRNWVACSTAADDACLLETIDHVDKCYNDVVKAAIDTGNDPAMDMAIWLEESGASNYLHFPDVADFGCVAASHNSFRTQLNCYDGLQGDYASWVNSNTTRACSTNPPSGKLNVDKFLLLFQGGYGACDSNNQTGNAHFRDRIKQAYRITSKDTKDLNIQCILESTRWDDTCP